ncbi:MAG: emp24/gp25L/p24 family/GOLD-domain-containing protein [Piptocephalis tieghemiana]|nr:MAG: emp24/gp25L/p24 family/GOLD-domain-containing protein [Piptocephalis tieghemiana]
MRLLTVGLGLLLGSLGMVQATTLTAEFPANSGDCYYGWVEKPDVKVGFYFAVQSGDDFEVATTVTDPTQRVVFHEEKQRQGDFLFTAYHTGEYTFCFENPGSAKLIDFDITIEGESHKASMPLKHPLDAEKHSSMEESVYRLDFSVANIHRLQRYFRTRENRNFSTVTSTQSRLFWFSAVQCLLIAAMAGAQVFAVRTFFSNGKRGGRI